MVLLNVYLALGLLLLGIFFSYSVEVGSKKELFRLLEAANADAETRVFHASVGSTFSIDAATEALDTFLKPRPHWVLVTEPRWSSDKTIILSKYPPRGEPFMRFLGARQYPPKGHCRELPVIVPYFTGGTGWGSLFMQYSAMMDGRGWGIFAPFVSKTGSASDVTYLGPEEWCPHTVNKWLCEFMSPTSCTMPAGVLDGSQLPPVGALGLYVGDQGWVNGNPSAHAVGKEPFHSYQKHIKDQWPFETLERRIGGEVGPLSPNWIWDRNNDSRLVGAARNSMTLYGLLWRFNAATRARMEALKAEVRDPALTTSCTAIHIRRGDRVIAGLDAEGHVEYCRTHVAKQRPGAAEGEMMCVDLTDKDEKEVSCTSLLDLGCFRGDRRGIFGGLELADYLGRAKELSDARRVFIMTDDPVWLKEEVQKLGPKTENPWHVTSFARSNDRYNAVSGLHYFTSVELARECTAFVGHFGSAVSMQLRDAMCVHHGARGGLLPTFGCPPTVDIGRGLYGENHVGTQWGDRRRLQHLRGASSAAAWKGGVDRNGTRRVD
jgi:hypothetical protein